MKEMLTVKKYGATWCTQCKSLEAGLHFLKRSNPDHFEIIEVNIDDNPDDALKSNVRSIPTLVLLDGLGLEVDRRIGAMPLDKLKQFLRITDTKLDDDLPKELL